MHRPSRTRSSLGRKLAISLAAVAAVLLALSYSSLNAIVSLGGLLDAAANRAARKITLATEIGDGFQDMEDLAKRTQLAHSFRHMEATTQASSESCSGCHVAESAEESRRAFEAIGGKVDRDVREARLLLGDDRGRAALDVLERGVGDWIRLYREYLDKASGKDFMAAHRIISEEMLPITKDIDASAATLFAQQRAFFADSNGRALQTTRRNRILALFLMAVAFVVMAGVSRALLLASGGLRRVTEELRTKAQEVASAACNVTSSSESLARGASEQAGSLQEVSAASEDIRSSAQKNSAGAQTSAEVSTQVSRSLNDANCRLEQLVCAMREMQASSAKVARIVGVIDQIAFQTNILSLNAAVEAARAGTSGLGFGVVADEIRGLAQRSAEAAKETSALIGESVSASQHSMENLQGVIEAFRSVAGGAAAVTRLAEQVGSGSREQAESLESIAGQIQEMRSNTERSAEGADKGAEAGRELQRQAEGLKEIVAELVEIAGSGTSSGRAGRRQG